MYRKLLRKHYDRLLAIVAGDRDGLLVAFAFLGAAAVAYLILPYHRKEFTETVTQQAVA